MIPRWLVLARTQIGEAEIMGKVNNPKIEEWWRAIKRGGIKDDETPWCAAFVGAMLEYEGIKSTRFESAKSYLSWGTELKTPCLGCVVIFDRDGGGHVGFVVGESANGDLLVLGGNQGDCVSVKAFKRKNALSYRWPLNEPLLDEDLIVGAADLAHKVS